MPDLNLDSVIQKDSSIITSKPALHVSTIRFEGEPMPQLPQNESWIFGVVFILFIFLIFSINRSYSWIIDSLKNITKVRTRNSLFSKTTAEEYQSKFLLVIFAVGVISLYVYLTFFPESTLSLPVYLLLVLSGLIFLLLKQAVTRIVAFTFFNYELFKTGSESYYNILSMLGFLLFPLLILKIYYYDGINVKLFDTLAVIFTLSAFFFMTVKLFQIFYRKILDFFHILLYLCTLEIIPLISMCQAYKWIIKEF